MQKVFSLLFREIEIEREIPFYCIGEFVSRITTPDTLFAFMQCFFAFEFHTSETVQPFYWITFLLNWKLLIFYIALSYFYRHSIVEFLPFAHCPFAHCIRQEKPMNCKFARETCIGNIWFPKISIFFLIVFCFFVFFGKYTSNSKFDNHSRCFILSNVTYKRKEEKKKENRSIITEFESMYRVFMW